MSVEGISEGDVVVDFIAPDCLESSEEKQEVEKLDIQINSCARPKICTAFDQVKFLDPSRVVVILSDGSQWNINCEKYPNAFYAIIKNWEKGDDIRVRQYSDGKDDEFIMKNIREKSTYLTQLSQECDDLSKAYFLTKVDETGYALRTQDGKQWAVGYWGSFDTQYWEEGDRVILNKSTHSGRYEDYDMIHPGKMDSVWVTQVFADESEGK